MSQPDKTKFKRLVDKLKELFQLDEPELDFGIYRIMHAKAGEVTQFLEQDLLPQVRDVFAQHVSKETVKRERQLAEMIASAIENGFDPEQSPKIREVRKELAGSGIGALENDVYDHLHAFFRRYYSEGDFLSKRVYKEGVYAIPYEGEEVKLHWANSDQYYIKTSEYLRDYAFRLRPEHDTDPMRVHLKLAEASEDEHGSVKVADSKERQFVLAADNFIEEQAGELVLHFEYRAARVEDWPEAQRAGKDKPPTREALTSIAEQRVFAVTDASLQRWIAELRRLHFKADGQQADYSRLLAHLCRYTARNTFDYFIHKDLGGFLRRELDFYIKNEVMRLDDIESESVPNVEQYLSKVRAMRRIAGKIIDFLAQLEDFQKKLWLKKKFVVETAWCIRIGCIPEALYPEIVASAAQREEWIRLCAIDGLKGDMATPGYTDPLTAEFLKAHSTLMLDTRHFAADFTARLLESIEGLDEQVDGVLFHCDNFQALALMQARYGERVACIYIDPPYNTDASAIDYKNGYKASSWISLMDNRVSLSRATLAKAGVLVAAIDDEQQRELSFILSDVFDGRLLGTVCVRSNPSGRPTQAGYSVSHEYLLFAGKSTQSVIGRMPPTKDQMSRFSQSDGEGAFEWRNLRREGSNSDRSARRALYYPIYIEGEAIRVPAMRWEEKSAEWIVEEEPRAGEQVAWPDNEDGVQKTWRWEGKTVMKSLDKLSIRKDRAGRDYVYFKRRPHEGGVVSVSSWVDAKYSATEHGTALLKHLFGSAAFSYPKSIHAVRDALYIGGAAAPQALVLDYFGGSGTTAHAVMNMNREDGGHRKFVLVEMGSYFDTVLLPRLKKVAFTPEWKDGRPARPATPEETARSPRIMKIVRLESYEDALNNLEIKRTERQQLLLDDPRTRGSDKLREQYLLRYQLEVESRGSASLLNIAAFADPTSYKLKVKRAGGDESRDENVDLLETFNWLIGLSVRHIAAPKSFAAQFERNSEGRLRTTDQLREDANGPWWFRTVTGTTPEKKRALIVWRKLAGDAERDNLVLDTWFTNQGYSTRDAEFDLIYVNGGNTLENLRADGDTWKVRLIEAEFHRLMFDTAGC